MDGAAAREAHRERLVVGVPEGDDTLVARAPEHLERGFHPRALDASARHRSGDLTVVAHRHRRTGIARARALERHHTCDRDAMPRVPPPFDVVQHFLHGFTPDLPFVPSAGAAGAAASPLAHELATPSTSPSSDASEWPSTNSST